MIRSSNATETTLAEVLAKLIPEPATEAKQDVLNAKDFATQTTLASILTQLNTTGLKKIIDALPAGTNNIGDVDVASLPTGVIAGMTTLPAGTNNIGDVDIVSSVLPTGASTEATLASIQATLAQGGIPATTLETTHQDTASVDGNGAAATVSGYGPISFQVTGTFDTATVTWEGSVDGTNYLPFSATKTDTGVEATTATAVGIYKTDVSGYKSVRAVISTAGAGTSLTVKSLAVGIARPLSANVTTVGSSAHDAAATGNPVQIGGVYRASDPALADGDAGSIRVNAKGEVLTQLTGSILADDGSGNLVELTAIQDTETEKWYLGHVDVAPAGYDSTDGTIKIKDQLYKEVIVSDANAVTITAGSYSTILIPNPEKYKSLLIAFTVGEYTGTAFTNHVDVNMYINSNTEAKRLAKIALIASGSRKSAQADSGTIYGDYVSVAIYNESASPVDVYRYVAGVLK